MKKYFIFLTLFTVIGCLSAQQRKYSTYHEQRCTLFELLPTSPTDILFVGNSITDGGEWAELFDNKHVKNRGISGDISAGVLDRINPLVAGKPRKFFLMIGVNDIAKDIPIDTIAANIDRILHTIRTQSPATEIYLQSVLPTNPDFKMFEGHMKPEKIKTLNSRLQQLAETYQTGYINLYERFVKPGTDHLDPQFSNDGLHLTGPGYIHWRNIVRPYVEQ